MRRARALHAILAASVSLAAVGCAHQYLDPRLYGQVRGPAPDTTAGTVQIRFLAVGGFLLQRGNDVVMTAPFYTNPDEGFLFGTRKVRPNKTLISRLLREDWGVKNTKAILVGHTHYDHFMDVPYIAKHLAPNATLYGNENMKYLAMAEPYKLPEDRLVVVSDVKGTNLVDYRQCTVAPKEGCYHGKDEGAWIEVIKDRVRIRALCSRHAGPRMWKGCLKEVPAEPLKVGHWKLGDTYAYLIDFLDATGKTVFRVYYQDSATSPTYGYVDPALTPKKEVDVALLCAAGFDWVKNNPSGILENTKPRYVIYGHWETFFKTQEHTPLESLAYFDYSDLVGKTDLALTSGSPWERRFWVAAPGNLFVFEPKS